MEPTSHPYFFVSAGLETLFLNGFLLGKNLLNMGLAVQPGMQPMQPPTSDPSAGTTSVMG
jgi:hypothetical protein